MRIGTPDLGAQLSELLWNMLIKWFVCLTNVWWYYKTKPRWICVQKEKHASKMHFFRHMRVLRSQARRDDQSKENRKTVVKIKKNHTRILFVLHMQVDVDVDTHVLHHQHVYQRIFSDRNELFNCTYESACAICIFQLNFIRNRFCNERFAYECVWVRLYERCKFNAVVWANVSMSLNEYGADGSMDHVCVWVCAWKWLHSESYLP